MASNGWATLPFDEAVHVNPPVPLQRGTVYPFVDMQALDPSFRSVSPSELREFAGSGARFMDGDTLMARITPCLENGKIARFAAAGGEPAAHGSTEFIVIRGRPNVTDTAFAYYLTKWEGVRQYCISQMTGSSGRQRVPTSALSHFKIAIPPLKEQQAIACVLGSLDDKIEINRKTNRTSEAIAQAIFKSWFMDFDPVQAKAAGGKPPGLAPQIAKMFPDVFQNSGKAKIPRGWRECPLDEFIEVNPGRRLAAGTLAPYLDMAAMPTEGYAPDAWTERAAGSGMRFINGDTLVARITPCLENGKTAYVDFLKNGEVGWGSTEYIVLRPKEPIPPMFAYLLARSPEFRTFAIQQMTGSSGRQRVPADSLSRYRVAAPALDSPLFPAFGVTLQPLFERIRSAMEGCRTLSTLRDALLPKLLSGELRIADAERIAARCA